MQEGKTKRLGSSSEMADQKSKTKKNVWIFPARLSSCSERNGTLNEHSSGSKWSEVVTYSDSSEVTNS